MANPPPPASGAPDPSMLSLPALQPAAAPDPTPTAAPKTTPRRRKTEAAFNPASLDTAALHTELHRATQANADEETILAAIRQTVMKHTLALGVAHLTFTGQGDDGKPAWELKPENASGRIPERNDFLKKFATSCQAVVQRGSIQMEHFLGVQAIYAPIQATEGQPEVLLVLTDDRRTTHTVFVLEIVNAYLSLFLKTRRASDNDWKLVSLSALIDLVSQIESQTTLPAACEVVSNELVRHLGAKDIAVGMLRHGQMTVHSLSGTINLDRASEIYHGLEMALSESVLRETPGIYPPRDGDDTHLLVAHRQLCGDLQVPAVMSSPLTTPEGETIGAMVITGDSQHIHGDRLPHFVRAATPRIASALEVVARAQLSRFGQLIANIKTALPSIKGWTWSLIGLFALCVMLMPVRYRVRCNCTTEPTVRRFAVAPFQGLIEKGFAKQGDHVKANQLLARMDGQPIRWEMASVTAEQQQAAKQREIELAERNVTASLLSQLESKRLIAKTRLLEHQKSQIEIRSPIDGVIIAGNLDRAEAAAVDTGEVIYEIAPLQQMRIEATVPAAEVTYVSEGQTIRIWIDGMSSQSFLGTIERIHPQSELREGKNVFVATVTLDNKNDLLRPGMTGTVRIDGDRYPLAWNILHRPYEYLKSRLTWW